MRYEYFNPNPTGKNVGDCTVRAISKALGQNWDKTYIGIVIYGLMLGDMPSANTVWGAYLRSKGYARRIVPEECPDCYTVADFADDNPHGTFILALSGHVVCIQDGVIYYTERTQKQPPVATAAETEYVTRNEFNALAARIDELTAANAEESENG